MVSVLECTRRIIVQEIGVCHLTKEGSFMSYDMHIGHEQFNYTWNVSPMWYKAYPEKGIRLHYGMLGKSAIQPLRTLREYMEDNRDTLVKLNPENGWGDYDGALQFVTNLINASIRNPDEIWEGD